MPPSIVLDGESLAIGDVAAVADGAPVAWRPRHEHGWHRTRAIVDAIVERRDVVYGVTTGFGKLSDVAIPLDRLAELQVNLVRSHAAGVGPHLPEREVRAMMLLRANVLAKGYSGCRRSSSISCSGCSTQGCTRRCRSREVSARAVISRRSPTWRCR